MNMAWQPIETAPKDGTSVLIFEPPSMVYVCEYSHGEWVEAGGEGYATWKPTHWLPLPEPPEKEGAA